LQNPAREVRDNAI